MVPGLRPGRGPAQQRRAPAGAPAATAPRAVRRRARCRTSTRSTRASRVDALVTNRVWTAMGLDPATTLHDVRWGEHYRATDRRFRLGVRDLRLGAGVAPAGGYAERRQRAPAADVLPARRRHAQGRLQARRDRLEPRVRHGRRPARRHRPGHVGRRCRRRRPSGAGRRPPRSGRSCTPCCTASRRDQLMARHKANHLNVVYAPGAEDGRQGVGRQGRDAARAWYYRAPLRQRELVVSCQKLDIRN